MKQHISIRPTTAADYAAVYDLIRTAFETAEHSDGDEQDFAVSLREGPNYIPELDLIAECDGQPIGHIMLTKTHVTRPDGSRYDTLMVAPLSVLIGFRGTGVGSALMGEGLRRAAETGYGAAFLLGDPGYYQRLGFRPAHLLGIRHESFPAEYVMAREIVPHALEGITGVIHM